VITHNPRKNSFADIAPGAWESCDAIVVSRMPIGADAIPLLKRCRVIVRNGVGFDVIDLKACGNAGITVCNVPDYGTTEVADTAIAMMLTFARGTASLDAALRADLKGGWTHVHNVTRGRLRGATFGVSAWAASVPRQRCARARSACRWRFTILICRTAPNWGWESPARVPCPNCSGRPTW